MEGSSKEKSSIPSNEKIIEEITDKLSGSTIDESARNEKFEDSNSKPKIQPSASEDFIEGLDKSEDEEETTNNDDYIDEEVLKDSEVTYSDEDRQVRCNFVNQELGLSLIYQVWFGLNKVTKLSILFQRLRSKAQQYKTAGNNQFKSGEYKESALSYTLALRTCPLAFHEDRAVLFANRAATKMKLILYKSGIEDCSKSIELKPDYLKAYHRRAQMYEQLQKLDEALADFQKILELDPSHKEAMIATKRLPPMIEERNEKLKTEMLDKLKDLGNLILRPFGLSTENFKLNQDPNTGGYSVNFQQQQQQPQQPNPQQNQRPHPQ
uniref:(California timema) hypothetical protein n=2 Tax=Timema TaxID=61471 RepID=A0A7R9IXL7_TIMCA|nr:unnamed protein product [Timema californicum]